MMKENTIIPLLQESMLNPACLNNCKAISFSSLFEKIFDHLIMYWYASVFKTNENQYVFKVHSSYNHSTLALTETMKYYTSNGSNRIFVEWNLFRLFYDNQWYHRVEFLFYFVYTEMSFLIFWRRKILDAILVHVILAWLLMQMIMFCCVRLSHL